MHDFIIDINDLSDSRELLEAKPPKVIKIFIYFILLMLITGFVWISLSFLEITTKSPGMIRPTKDISNVRNIVSGYIGDIYFSDGDYIKKGDLLYTIDTESLNLDLKDIETKIERIIKQRDNTITLKNSVLNGENKFRPENIEFYNRYLTFELEREKLELTYYKAIRELEDEKNLIESMRVKRNIDELESTLRFNELNLKSYTSKMLVSLENELTSYKEELILLRKNKRTLEDSIEKSTIRASISGRIQQIVDFNSGDYLSMGIEVMRILPTEDSVIKVDIMVSNKDITGIEVGDRVSYKFPALPEKEYGIFHGFVTKIPGDVTTTGTNTSVYVLEGSIESDSLELKNGMFCDARIITREQRILDYLLEKLDFKS